MGGDRRVRVGPGDLVAVSLPPGPAWIALLEDLWAAGAAVLPVDERLGAKGTRAVLDRAAPTVISDEGGSTVVPEGRRVDPEMAFAMPTSGTRGAPRIAALSRAAVDAAVRASSTALGAKPDHRWLGCLPVAHIGGMLVLLRAVLTGASVDLHPTFDPHAVARADADFVSLVPTMLHRLVAADADLSRFRAILVGGAALEDETADAARSAGAKIVATYGLTESCGGAVYDGRPLSGWSCRLGPEDELQLSGPSLMDGYLSDPAATATAFTLDGWLRTGDAGSVDEGVVRVHGRLDECIRTGAEKVWPQEVEAALREHPQVAEVAVGGRTDPEWGQHVVAFVVPADLADPPSLDDLRDHAAARIARFKAPRELVLLPSIPRTASGKVVRDRLR